MASKFTILVAIFLGIVTASKGEVFTALAHMKGLIDLEQELLVELEQYIKTHPKMPVKFHELVNEVKTHSGFIQGDVETFLGHPLNAYMLIRRFRGRWVDLGNYLNQHDKDSELAEIINFNINTTTSKQDVYGCVGAIMRIQEVYRIDAKAIADGNLSHKTKTLPLNADVCFEMGFAYYKNDDFDHAYSWFNETLARLNLPDYKGELTRVHVLEYQAWSEYMTDRLIDALNHTMEILRMDHNNDFGIRNIEFLTDEVQKALNKGGPYERQDPYFKSKKKAKEEYMEVYERLCRGEAKKSKEELAQLYCYYERKRHPMLLIRPLKVEIVNHEPYIVMLRDVMYDSEIDYIKARAAPMLNRATVTNPTTGDLEYADYRVSKSGWLEDHLHDSPDNILKRVNRRISVITGLDARRTSAEALQIVNYGTAGHYEPHYDHATESYSAIMRLGMGNRIATVLFYMTDVEAGGYTVFVDTEAISKPSKGDAAFWYNLMRSGEGDPYTRHAGCPVVVGSKWVCNKWIHEHGQEFRRPCTLSIDE